MELRAKMRSLLSLAMGLLVGLLLTSALFFRWSAQWLSRAAGLMTRRRVSGAFGTALLSALLWSVLRAVGLAPKPPAR